MRVERARLRILDRWRWVEIRWGRKEGKQAVETEKMPLQRRTEDRLWVPGKDNVPEERGLSSAKWQRVQTRWEIKTITNCSSSIEGKRV